MKKLNISVIGSTGLVGMEFVRLLEASNIEIDNLYLYASKNSSGKEIIFRNKKYKVLELKQENLKSVDITFLFIDAELVKKWIDIILIFSKYVIDNSSCFRKDDNIPLIVPEVNISDVKKESRIISNPNCSTIQCVMVLSVLKKLYTLKRIVYTTYQSVSGSGQKGINEYYSCLKTGNSNFYQHNITKTCIPKIGSFTDDGYTLEEHKMIDETRKILHVKNLNVSATCVRVPIEIGHAVNVLVEFETSFNLDKIKKLLQDEAGIVLLDDIYNDLYPTTDITCNSNDVFVGRIRRDLSSNNSLLFYCASNNLTRGASYNALKILEKLLFDGIFVFR